MEKSELLLSSMRALWGILTPNVRMVSISYCKSIISLHFYYNTNPSEIEIELSEEAASEVVADFSGDETIVCDRHIVEYPNPIEVIGFLVYSRYEA